MGLLTEVSSTFCKNSVSSPSWFKAGFCSVSLALSLTPARLVRDRRLRFNAVFGLKLHGFAVSSARHATGLRILLLIAGIESNPGPGWNEFRKETLIAVLRELKADDADFEPPRLKAEVVAAIELEDHRLAQMALRLVREREISFAPQAPLSGSLAPADTRLINLPCFSSKNCRVWFDQVEAMLGNSSASAKKNSLIGALNTDVIMQSGADLSQDFEVIKTCVLAYYDETDERRLRKLLEKQTLGDRKPSVALRDLQRLAPGNENLIKLRFLEMLPESIRMVLASLDTLGLEKMSEVADKMMEQLVSASTAVRSVSAASDRDDPNAEMREMVCSLTRSMDRMNVELQDLKKQRPWTPRGRVRVNNESARYRTSGSAVRDRSNSRMKLKDVPPEIGICFYHYNFGMMARKCKQPCRWGQSANAPGSDSSVNFIAPGDAATRGARINAIHVAAPAIGHFLVDSGSDCSVLPMSYAQSQKNSAAVVSLRAANGAVLATAGTRTLDFTLPVLGRQFSWVFIVADVTQPILGLDFMSHYSLAVDCKNHRLVQLHPSDNVKKKTVSGSPFNSMCLSALSTSHGDQMRLLLQQYQVLFKPLACDEPICHPVQHHIQAKGPPCFARPRRLFGEKLQVAQKTFQKLEAQGIIYRGESPWASPLHKVEKKRADKWRPCGDYRQLNLQTVPDRYPMVNLADITNSFHGCQVFSKLDLVSAYHQIPVAEEDQPKTALTTPFGLFLFRRMPFGIRNASQTFQRLVDMALQDLPFARSYIDDMIIASASAEQHFYHLRLVLQRLQQYGLRLREEKCSFFQETVHFVGMELSTDGFRPLPEKVEAVENFVKPSMTRGLRRFLGMPGFYYRFVPKFSDIAAPLTDLTRNATSPTSKCPVQWSDKADAAFVSLKNAFKNVVSLSLPCAEASLELTTDASGSAIGAVLNQNVKGVRQPLAFYSKKLTEGQSKMSAYDRELYAVYQSLRHFDWLLGSRLTIFTDHKPLTHSLGMKSPTPQQSRWLSFISQFDCVIEHISGRENVVADSLSRDINAIDFSSPEDLAEAQKSDLDLMKFIRTTDLPVKRMTFNGNDVWCDSSGSKLRPFLPEKLRRSVFDEVHGLSHPGTRVTQVKIANDYVWPGMKRNVRQWCRTCQHCQRSKISRHTKAPIGSIPTCSRFHTIHVDIVGPLPNSDDNRYLLTVIDRFTQWPEAIPIRDMCADTVALGLINGWISRFGVPKILITDRGSQFESLLWQHLMQHLGIERRRTTSYHPACNGAIERFHRSLKASLRAVCRDNKWHRSLPMVLLGLRTSVKSNGYSPAEMTYGCNLALPGQYFMPESDRNEIDDDFVRELFAQMNKLPKPEREHKGSSYVPPDLGSASHVWLRDAAPRSSLSPRYLGPFKVLTRSEKTFTIEKGGSAEVVSLDRLKPAHVDPSGINNHPDPASFLSEDGSVTSGCLRPSGHRLADNFPVGRVVLAKYSGYPPWPAIVVEAKDSPLSGRRCAETDLAVKFFGTNKYAFIPHSLIEEFKMDKDSKHQRVRRAIRLAKETIKGVSNVSPLKDTMTFMQTAKRQPSERKVTFSL